MDLIDALEEVALFAQNDLRCADIAIITSAAKEIKELRDVIFRIKCEGDKVCEELQSLKEELKDYQDDQDEIARNFYSDLETHLRPSTEFDEDIERRLPLTECPKPDPRCNAT